MSEDQALAAARARIRDYRARIGRLDDDSLDLVFREARNHNWWQEREVADEQLREIWDLTKFGSTSANTLPARIVFVRSPEAKEKLRPLLVASQRGQDHGRRRRPRFSPTTSGSSTSSRNSIRCAPKWRSNGSRTPLAAEAFAMHQSTMQGAYLILAIRAVGLDAGAMLGFDRQAADKAFLEGTTWRSNFLCNIGYGDLEGIKGPRLYRYAFDEACRIV